MEVPRQNGGKPIEEVLPITGMNEDEKKLLYLYMRQQLQDQSIKRARRKN